MDSELFVELLVLFLVLAAVGIAGLYYGLKALFSYIYKEIDKENKKEE